jgi:hypothetical protein
MIMKLWWMSCGWIVRNAQPPTPSLQRPASMIVRGIRLETGRIRLTIMGNRSDFSPNYINCRTLLLLRSWAAAALKHPATR